MSKVPAHNLIINNCIKVATYLIHFCSGLFQHQAGATFQSIKQTFRGNTERDYYSFDLSVKDSNIKYITQKNHYY